MFCLLELDDKIVEAINNFCFAKDQVTVDHRNIIRFFKKFRLGRN